MLGEDGPERRLDVEPGTVLRDALLDAGLSPHGRYARRLNCGGRGLCATCGVRFGTDDPDPDHWHDELADRFGYPRLSCQLRVTDPATVCLLPEKRVWGAGSSPAQAVCPSPPNCRQ
nr:2Fe-2S iron-sulfur cluster-binding protein [Halapricum sp. CBA1109]